METLTLKASLDWATVQTADWDVVVVGAGPAGIAAAMESTRLGLKTLLLDRQQHPRDKVCGGCMNAVALSQLAALGCADLPDQHGAITVDRFRLGIEGRQIDLDLPPGRALSRRSFDAALLTEALRQGVQFMPMVSVRDAGCSSAARHLILTRQAETATLKAAWVVAADGLGGRYTQGLTGCQTQTRPAAYIGVATEVGDTHGYPAGIIHMASRGDAYVGVVRQENNRLHLAAAVHPATLRQAGSPARMMRQVLQHVAWPVPDDLDSGHFQGTSYLTTRRRPVALERVFLSGDAAGYIEPFTGEGMAWALLGGRTVATLLPAAVSGQNGRRSAEAWIQTYTQMIRQRQAVCHWTTRCLRHPWLIRAMAELLSRLPGLATPLIQSINTPPARSTLP